MHEGLQTVQKCAHIPAPRDSRVSVNLKHIIQPYNIRVLQLLVNVVLTQSMSGGGVAEEEIREHITRALSHERVHRCIMLRTLVKGAQATVQHRATRIVHSYVPFMCVCVQCTKTIASLFMFMSAPFCPTHPPHPLSPPHPTPPTQPTPPHPAHSDHSTSPRPLHPTPPTLPNPTHLATLT